MTQAPLTLASKQGSPGARVSSQRTMPAMCTAQRGFSSPKACVATCSSSSFTPRTMAGKLLFALEFPSAALILSQVGAAQSWLVSDLGFCNLLKKNPLAEEQLVAAGDFPQESVSLSLGRPGCAIACGMSRGRASPHPARCHAAPSATPGDPRGSAPKLALQVVAWSASAPFPPVLT